MMSFEALLDKAVKLDAINRDLLAALKSVIERFPGNGRVTCRACDTTFREDDPPSHPRSCPVAAAIAKAEHPITS